MRIKTFNIQPLHQLKVKPTFLLSINLNRLDLSESIGLLYRIPQTVVKESTHYYPGCVRQGRGGEKQCCTFLICVKLMD